MEPAYWECPKSDTTGDTISNIIVFLSCSSLILSLSLLTALCFLTGKTRTYLTHLRAITASTVLCSLIGFCNNVIPARFVPTDYIFGRIVCHIWRSLYLLHASYIFSGLNLVFMVGHRAIQIGDKYQNSHAPTMLPDLTCVVLIGVSSVLSIICQVFVVEWNGSDCLCREKGLPYLVLVSAYVGTFVRFGLTVIISPIIMGISCYKIAQWVRKTSPEKLFDTWNGLAFPGATEQQVMELLRPRGWMTASMCTVPLSINMVACSLYITVHQFVCAVGLCRVELDRASYRMGILLIYLQLFFSPIIIAVYIPALRDPVERSLKRLLSRLILKAQKWVETDAADLQVP
ncbi:unnamed protein product [Dibothriocephalus latus]|uniref:G-protein coupled receptors family 1 profile domain-containing protein n=1 Tax=Dibothriocephalus latus TaxID=60516 RepID=A0A3P7P7E5_DIBLA|nr:unnamed protein product [Dibothriocephalus latus]